MCSRTALGRSHSNGVMNGTNTAANQVLEVLQLIRRNPEVASEEDLAAVADQRSLTPTATLGPAGGAAPC